MEELHYYNPELNIDGTADELAKWAEDYTDDYSNEAILEIQQILESEGKFDKATRVSFILESKIENDTDQIDLGKMKRWALDGMYELLDTHEDRNYNLTVVSEREQVIIHVLLDSGEQNSYCMPLEKFLSLSAYEFEILTGQCLMYAYSIE